MGIIFKELLPKWFIQNLNLFVFFPNQAKPFFGVNECLRFFFSFWVLGPVWSHAFGTKMCFFGQKNSESQMFGSIFLENYVFKTNGYVCFRNGGDG